MHKENHKLKKSLAASVSASVKLMQCDDSAAAKEITHHHIRIVLTESDYFVAILNQQKIHLKTALSCLIKPQIGDLVLSSIAKNSQEGYILAILESPGERAVSELVFPGDVSINAPHGKITIQAKSDIDLCADKNLNIETQNFLNNADKVVYNNKHLELKGTKFQASFENSYWNCSDTFFVKTMNSQLQCKESLRRVTGHEEVLTKSFRQYVDTNWVLHTRTTAMYADETTSIKASLVSLA